MTSCQSSTPKLNMLLLNACWLPCTASGNQGDVCWSDKFPCALREASHALSKPLMRARQSLHGGVCQDGSLDRCNGCITALTQHMMASSRPRMSAHTQCTSPDALQSVHIRLHRAPFGRGCLIVTYCFHSQRDAQSAA